MIRLLPVSPPADRPPLLPAPRLLPWIKDFNQPPEPTPDPRARPGLGPVPAQCQSSPVLLQDGRSTALFGCDGRRSPADLQN